VNTKAGSTFEAALWVREWNERSSHLLGLLDELDGGESLNIASELLAWVKDSRKLLGEPVDPRLRELCNQFLDEIWEAACASIYGDLGQPQSHADAALRTLREIDAS
jgi:hypothetical protein